MAASLSEGTAPLDRWVRRAQLLAIATILYNVVEGVVAVGFGVEEASISLVGFGIDSFIEVGSASLVLWRFRGERAGTSDASLARERRATLGIGLLFVLLAAGIAAGAIAQLSGGGHPVTTVPGVIVAGASILFMLGLWRAKTIVAARLGSATVAKDAACSRACLTLSFVLLAGSLLYWIEPALHFADGAAALVLAVLIGREGVETVRAARSKDFDGGCGCHGSCDT